MVIIHALQHVDAEKSTLQPCSHSLFFSEFPYFQTVFDRENSIDRVAVLQGGVRKTITFLLL